MIRLSGWISILRGRVSSLRIGAIGIRQVGRTDAGRAIAIRSVPGVGIGCGEPVRRSISLLLVVVKVVRSFIAAAPHPDVTANPHPAALLRNDAAQRGAHGEPGELLCAINAELVRENGQSEVERGLGRGRLGRNTARVGGGYLARRGSLTHILAIFGLLIQMEIQVVVTLVPHR